MNGGWTEKVFLRLARMSFVPRRFMFWLFWHAGAALRHGQHLAIVSDLARVLCLPRRQARTVAAKQAYCDLLGLLEWATFKYRPTQALIADTRYVKVTNESHLEQLGREERSVIFAPLHMGGYVFGMVTLIWRHFRGWKVLILRSRTDLEDDTFVLERVGEIGSELRFMNISETATFIDALRFARKKTVVICFVDLPASYGSPEDVELFGRPARLAMGIELLARALDAPIVPMRIHSHTTYDDILVRRPFEAGTATAANRKMVARLIAAHIEASVVEGPEHWHMWPKIDQYLDEAPTGHQLSGDRQFEAGEAVHAQ